MKLLFTGMTSSLPRAAITTFPRSVLFAWLILGSVSAKPEISLSGAGASFPNEVYQNWAVMYTAERQAYITLEMSYDAIGSGSGKKRIMGKTGTMVTYAGSDSLLSDEEMKNFPNLKMFPTMAGQVILKQFYYLLVFLVNHQYLQKQKILYKNKSMMHSFQNYLCFVFYVLKVCMDNTCNYCVCISELW
jgi:hypothetical protein